MTAPDRDPVVAAFEAILGWTSSPEIGGLVEDALPLARAQAALVAADVKMEDAREAYMRGGPFPGIAKTERYNNARTNHRAALAEYRRALEAK